MYELPKLDYSFDALEPFIDAKTMEIHYLKHHQTYVDKLNAALENYPEFQGKNLKAILGNLDQIPKNIRTAVRNHGGGHFNHSIFWKILKKNENGIPIGKFAEQANKNFGNFESFKKEFTEKATALFGSGWVWVVKAENGEISIVQTQNQDNPIMTARVSPIMGIDVWEHAYYLKYQNRRAEYIEAFWNILNWEETEKNFIEGTKI